MGSSPIMKTAMILLLAVVAEPELRGKVTHLLIRNIYKAFQREGIEIPYNKQELFIKELPLPRAAQTSEE